MIVSCDKLYTRRTYKTIFILVLFVCMLAAYCISRYYTLHRSDYLHPMFDTMFQKDTRGTFQLVKGTDFWMYNHKAVISKNLTGHQGILIIGFRKKIPPGKMQSIKNVECKVTFQDGKDEYFSAIIENVPPFPKWIFRFSPAYCWCFWKSNLIPIKVGLRASNDEKPVNITKLMKGVSSSERKSFAHNTVEIEKIRTRRHGNFALCVPYVYNFESVASFVEIMEFHRLQGVEKIIMHGYEKVSGDVLKVINYYRNIGYIDMLPWNIDRWKSGYGARKGKHHNVLRADGLHLIKGDCLHRYRDRYKYIIFTDLDELIIPSNNKIPLDLTGMLNYLISEYNIANTSTICEFKFKWTTFCVNGGPIHLRKSDEGMFTEKFIMKAPHWDRNKVIALTSNAYSMATHSSRLCRYNSSEITVDAKLIKCHHYRYRPVITQLGVSRGCTVSDHSALRYREKLKKHIQMVLNTVIQI